MLFFPSFIPFWWLHRDSIIYTRQDWYTYKFTEADSTQKTCISSNQRKSQHGAGKTQCSTSNQGAIYSIYSGKRKISFLQWSVTAYIKHIFNVSQRNYTFEVRNMHNILTFSFHIVSKQWKILSNLTNTCNLNPALLLTLLSTMLTWMEKLTLTIMGETNFWLYLRPPPALGNHVLYFKPSQENTTGD